MYVRERRKKRRKYCAITFEMHLNVNDWFDKGSLVKKMAANEEQLAMAMYKYSVVFGKSNKKFYRKDIKRNA